MAKDSRSLAAFARRVRWGTLALLAVMILFQLLALLPGQHHVVLHVLPAGGTTASHIIGLLHEALIILALAQLILLLRRIEKGELFSVGVTRHLRRFAMFILLAMLTTALLAPVLAFISSECDQHSGHCLRRIPFDMRAFWMLLISTLFFLVARLLDEARRIDEDNRQIV
jgi:hypothetical protein